MLLSLMLIMRFGTGFMRKEDRDLHWPCFLFQKEGGESIIPHKEGGEERQAFSPINTESLEKVRHPFTLEAVLTC